MESEDDVRPLIEDVSEGNGDLFLELTVQNINVDPEFEQVKFKIFILINSKVVSDKNLSFKHIYSKDLEIMTVVM